MDNQFYIYMMTNYSEASIYIGMTNDLIRRVFEHKNPISQCFTEKYNVDRLIYYEIYNDPQEAIAREKQLKKWSRIKKTRLINTMNPDWDDLYDKLI
ncbi:MAG: GIY-YIG nuclease family protein [Candidatus Gastranaerophilales bacterium]|nr:GIY-YIG nuclease family protein [Candidatus Gastranaerophilales bacterium]